MTGEHYPRSSAASSAWLAERQRDRIKGAERLSAAWFADRDEDVREILPSLEFNTPDCPVCLESTMFDDDVFICEVCGIVWPRSGYGQDAEIHEGGIGWAFVPSENGRSGA